MSLRALLSATAIVAASAATAQAATVTYLDTPPVPQVNPAPIATTGTVNQGLTVTLPGSYVSPWEGTSNYGTATFTSIQANSSATYAQSTPLTFLWSTPDWFNLVAFYKGDQVVDAIAGWSIAGSPFLQNGSAFVKISSLFAYDTVVFSSEGTAFEYSFDVEPAPVPLPAAGLLLLGGMGGLAALKRRRKA